MNDVRQRCPHVTPDAQDFLDTVKTNLVGSSVVGTHHLPLRLASAQLDNLWESTTLFTLQLTDSMDPDTVQVALRALERARNRAFPRKNFLPR